MRVGNHLAPLGKFGLHHISFRHHSATASEQVANVRHHGWVQHERTVGDGSKRLTRQVVRSWPQATAENYDFRSLNRGSNHRDHRVQIVAHRGVVPDAESRLLQPLAEPLGVCVETYSTGQFVANRDDFRSHPRVLCFNLTRSTAAVSQPVSHYATVLAQMMRNRLLNESRRCGTIK